jgi:hypothetical protein
MQYVPFRVPRCRRCKKAYDIDLTYTFSAIEGNTLTLRGQAPPGPPGGCGPLLRGLVNA